MTSERKRARELSSEQLRWRCDSGAFSFHTTEELDELDVYSGQARAIDAITFGLGVPQEGYNLFILGPPGTGRHDLARNLTEREAAGRTPPPDMLYLHNFKQPDEPIALCLPAGEGARLHEGLHELVRVLGEGLPDAFESDDYETKREAIAQSFQVQQEELLEEFRDKAREQDIDLLRTPSGLALAPLEDGEVMPPAQFEELEDQEREAIEERLEDLQQELAALMKRAPQWESEHREQRRELDREVALAVIRAPLDALKESWAEHEEVLAHLEAIEEDVLRNTIRVLDSMHNAGPPPGAAGPNPAAAAAAAATARRPSPPPSVEYDEDEDIPNWMRRYRANLFVDHSESQGAPVIFEDNPTMENLFGRIEHRARFGALTTDFTLLRAGAVHRASGGYLILDARDLLLNPGSWEQLKRALFSCQLRQETSHASMGLASMITIEPDPMPLELKIVLIGERQLYYQLAQADPDFLELFKVPADMEEDVRRNGETVERYARLIGTLAEEDDLRPLSPAAVARVLEACVRVAGDRDRFTARTLYMRDLLRESNYWAKIRLDEAGRDNDFEASGAVQPQDVEVALEKRVERQARLRDRMQERIEQEIVHIATEGKALGQINGLAVLQIGNFAFGRPNRISATVAVGRAELVDIEREVQLGGPIHSKGILILNGFLHQRFGQQHPLSLRASLVFEQSYGGVDGDSASMAECCALISALSDLPLRQDLAITGALDQRGRAQAIGGVNEKIEGFFDVCASRGLSGHQGVIIPASNVRHLQLRQDVVDAVDGGKFTIFAVEHIDEALELLTGKPTGRSLEDGDSDADSVNARVAARLAQLAEAARTFYYRG